MPRPDLLLVGDGEDLTMAYVGWRARERGADVAVLDEGALGRDWFFAIDEEEGEATVTASGRDHDLARCAAYVRFHHDPAVPDGVGEDRVDFVAQRRSAMHLLLDHVGGAVANPPFAGHSNGAKPLQMRLLQDSGLTPPAWIATNDPQEARAFAAACPGGAVVKSCSGLRSEVRLFDEAAAERLAAGSPPVIVQACVAGADVRVHAVGDVCFATRMTGSGAVDYRFAEEASTYEAIDLPDAIAMRCIAHTRLEGLLIGGLDFKVDADGRWFCLECNPVPTFLPYEMSTGQPIADAVLDRLLV